MNFLRAVVQREGVTEGDFIRFVASTEGIKRDGRTLRTARWRLDNYRANPVVLWAHDYGGAHAPIGRAEVTITESQLLADVMFDSADPFAVEIERKTRAGFLNAVSVGWQDVRVGGEVWHDLMDVSVVPVPADPQALKLEEARALRGMLAELEDPAEPNTQSDENSVEVVSSAIGFRIPAGRSTISNWLESGIHSEFTMRADWLFAEGFVDREERMALSNAIGDGLNAYAAAVDNTVPALRERPIERRSVDERLPAGVRSGAVLSARNRGDLEQAVALIQGVVERAAPTESDQRSAVDDQPVVTIVPDNNALAQVAEMLRAFGAR